MLTLQKTNDTISLSALTGNGSVDELLAKEWLLTNGRGGYASSTILGCNTRGYHGLLTGSLNPPVNRVMGLSNCLEMIIADGQICEFSTFEFDGKFAPEGYKYLKSFSQDIGVHFNYETEMLGLTKSVYLLRQQDAAAVVYDFTDVRRSVEFLLRPFA